MSFSDPRAVTAPSTPPVRRAYRRVDQRVLAGVGSGLAEHLGVSVLAVRIGCVLAAAAGGFGIAVYAGLWLMLPAQRHLMASAPGLEAASRQGRRAGRTRRLEDLGPLVAVGAVVIGLSVLVNGLFGGAQFFWPLLLGVVGIAVLWRQADEAQTERWLDSSSRLGPLRAVVGRGGSAAYARLGAGVVLLASALVLFAVQSGQTRNTGTVLLAGAVGVVGLGLTAGPWLVRLVSDLSEEREARVRTEERADLAAHLHDSVLQTLALIQKHADDGHAVARLARAQERELRGWLFEDQPPSETSLVGGLRAAAAEVEDFFGVPVEIVTVGDAALSEALRPLVAAAREAMVNAAKHSGAAQVDVYTECAPGSCEVFVRDRGRGFVPDEVPADRQGVRHSIEDRMRRHGGAVVIRTAPQEGTEVRLSMRTSRSEEDTTSAADEPTTRTVEENA